jgi:uncharacterized protein (TIGR03085 family)
VSADTSSAARAYHRLMTAHARRERAALADLLAVTGPDAPTLCAGWTTRDLAAHLVVRDRRPDAMAAVVIPPLAGHGEQVRVRAARRPYEQVVDEVRDPPWWSPVSNPLVHEQANTLEYFIHHEDVRRGAPGWTPRVLDAGEQAALWGAVKVAARLGLRRLRMPLLLHAPGFGELAIGGGTPRATLVGEPGELALFVSGRQRAARVDIEAPPETAERLRTAELGI